MKSVLQIVGPIVHETYGKGRFVQAGAEHIAERTEMFIKNPHPYRSTEYEVLNVVWNFFPGGDTAGSVTDKIIAALKDAGYAVTIKEDVA